MTIRELIELLSMYDEDTEVRLATQPHYPFEYSIRGVSLHDDMAYICEGDQLDYLDDEVFENVVW